MKAFKDLWEIFVEVMGFGQTSFELPDPPWRKTELEFEKLRIELQKPAFNKAVSKSEANRSECESFQKIAKDALFIPDDKKGPYIGMEPALDSPDAAIDWNKAEINMEVSHGWDDKNLKFQKVLLSDINLDNDEMAYNQDKDEIHYKGKVYRA